MFFAKRSGRGMAVARRGSAAQEPVVCVSLDLMNDVFTREAGRWCEHCGQRGSHYSEKHNIYASMALHISDK